MLFAGWDWASASHATIIDTAGRMVGRAGLACTEPDLDAALAGWPPAQRPPTWVGACCTPRGPRRSSAKALPFP